MSKRMRLPNGFGQISYLKGRRLRKPYRAMVTVGKTDEGRPVCKLLKPEAYFETYNDAYMALMDYRRNPYDFTRVSTFKEMYDKWLTEYISDKSRSTEKTTDLAYKCCAEVLHMDLREIRAWNIKSCMDQTKSPAIKRRVQFVFQEVLNLGMEYGYIEHNIAKEFSPKISNEGKKVVSEHSVITPEELESLWRQKDNHIARAILIQCYTGFRPQELCEIPKSDVNTEKWYITGGMKTKAGKNRVVPIIEKIKGIVGEAMADPGDMLVHNHRGNYLDYKCYYTHFKELLPNHKPHDPRKTFVTMCKAAGCDEYAIKRVVGHAITDITENIYTERDIEWLRSEIEKIV